LIGARVDGRPHGLLGRHVLGRAEDGALAGERGGGAAGEEARHAEVEDLDVRARAVEPGEHDVLGLEVAVDDAELVGARDAGGELAGDLEDAPQRRLLHALEHRPQRLAGDVLHHEAHVAFGGLAVPEGGDDVLVREGLHGEGLPLEAGEHDGVVRDVALEELHRDAPVRVLEILREEHGADATFAELRDDLVALADHGPDALGRLRLGRVHGGRGHAAQLTPAGGVGGRQAGQR
jgi:hypothetical protein